MTPENLICPVCGGKLTKKAAEKRFLCENGHSYDIAKQGYVNLLLPQKRGTSLPGDDAGMVRARTAFLNAGYYEKFSDAVSVICREALGEKKEAVIADAGCGEGYYTVRLSDKLSENGITPQVYGFDLSKNAVAHAAKTAGDKAEFAVASLFEMPLMSGSTDGIINLFAPVAEAEFARILKDDGFLLIAVPAEDHLFGLKAAVYDKPYKNEVRRDELEHFELLSAHRTEYEIELKSNADILSLFAMTPYYWKTSVSDAKKLEALDTLRTPVSFDLLLYRKK